jgi:microcystin-dependent protein
VSELSARLSPEGRAQALDLQRQFNRLKKAFSEQPDDAPSKEYVDALIPLGVALPFFGAAAPTGFAFPTGQTLLRETHPGLAAAIAPDSASPYWVDATNFRLPDMRTRVPVGKAASGTFGTLGNTGGAETHTLTTSQLPSHLHGVGTLANASNSGAHVHGVGFHVNAGSGLNGDGYGLLHASLSPTGTYTTPSGGGHSHTLSGSTASAGSGGSHNNLQPYMVCNWIMRLA